MLFRSAPLAAGPGGPRRVTRRLMAAILPILIFVLVVGAANFFEFGRVD